MLVSCPWTLPARRKDQEGRLVQQRVEVQVGSLADQLKVEAKGLADGFATAEGEYLEVVPEVFDAKAEVRLVGGANIHCPLGNAAVRSWRIRFRARRACARAMEMLAERIEENSCATLRTRPPGRINADLKNL